MSFRSSLFPRGDGTHYMVVKKEIRDKAGVSRGDKVRVIMTVDTEERIVEVPKEFQKVLEKNKKIKEAFDKFSYSYKKE